MHDGAPFESPASPPRILVVPVPAVKARLTLISSVAARRTILTSPGNSIRVQQSDSTKPGIDHLQLSRGDHTA